MSTVSVGSGESPRKSGWFVVNTRPRAENLAKTNLCRQGFNVLCPTIQFRRRRKNRWQAVIEPMFPGYLFVHLRFGLDDFSPIKSTIGCLGLVEFGSGPKPLPLDVVTPFLNMGDEPLEGKLSLASGEIVRFEEGPLVGLEAIFNESKGSKRVEVFLTLLGRQLPVSINQSNLSKV